MGIMEIHVGQMVEHRINEIGMSKAEFGRRINTSRQNVNTLLRKHIWDVQQIVLASSILGKNFLEPFQSYIEAKLGNSNSGMKGEENGIRFMIEFQEIDKLNAFSEWLRNQE